MSVMACGLNDCYGTLMIDREEIDGSMFWVHTCDKCGRKIVSDPIKFFIDDESLARLEALQTKNLKL